MAERQVTKSRKDKDGDITALCNDTAIWSPRSKENAIADIESGMHEYYVQQPGTQKAKIRVVGGHLQTEPDADQKNNLDNLPDC